MTISRAGVARNVIWRVSWARARLRVGTGDTSCGVSFLAVRFSSIRVSAVPARLPETVPDRIPASSGCWKVTVEVPSRVIPVSGELAHGSSL